MAAAGDGKVLLNISFEGRQHKVNAHAHAHACHAHARKKEGMEEL
jgi:hypothetical protein